MYCALLSLTQIVTLTHSENVYIWMCMILYKKMQLMDQSHCTHLMHQENCKTKDDSSNPAKEHLSNQGTFSTGGSCLEPILINIDQEVNIMYSHGRALEACDNKPRYVLHSTTEN